MVLSALHYSDNYSPAADLGVIVVSIVFYILIRIAFIKRSRAFTIFYEILLLIPTAAVCHTVYHLLLDSGNVSPGAAVYILMPLHHILLYFVLYLYVLYLYETVSAYGSMGRMILNLAKLGFAGGFVMEALLYLKRLTLPMDQAHSVHQFFGGFAAVYFYYIVLVAAMIGVLKTRVYHQIVVGVVATMCVSVGVMVLQMLFGEENFTTLTFMLPMFALLYLVHSNPYDMESGSVGMNAFEDSVKYSYSKKRPFYLVSLYMSAFDSVNAKYPTQLRDAVQRFSTKYFNRSTMFRLTGGRMILFFETARNKDYEEKIEQLLEDFEAEYSRFRYDYKLLLLDSNDELSANNDYVDLIGYVEKRMSTNKIHYISDKDIEAFRRHRYIIEQLKDIARHADPEDPRVLVFAQPVLNTTTGKFDTAEALMRLELPDTGMVFPDQFIPIAEQYNLIQPMTMIIFAKTCAQIKRMMDEGYFVRRISVNFSVLDIREENFCGNVREIIANSGIPAEFVAVEVTESRSEADFVMMKAKMEELQHTGIKFYLDDFGTGYSNFERIMELPFDIIKFDRSLTIASGNDVRTEKMVSHLAHLFIEMGYSVLYEGVEDDADEQRCDRMHARYLQGYKYSRPIPIGRLVDYFEKA